MLLVDFGFSLDRLTTWSIFDCVRELWRRYGLVLQRYQIMGRPPVLQFELFVRHQAEEDRFDDGDEGGDDCPEEEKIDDAAGRATQIEAVDAEPAEEQGQHDRQASASLAKRMPARRTRLGRGEHWWPHIGQSNSASARPERFVSESWIARPYFVVELRLSSFMLSPRSSRSTIASF